MCLDRWHTERTNPLSQLCFAFTFIAVRNVAGISKSTLLASLVNVLTCSTQSCRITSGSNCCPGACPHTRQRRPWCRCRTRCTILRDHCTLLFRVSSSHSMVPSFLDASLPLRVTVA